MKKILFPILCAFFVLASCENTERLEQIKAELKGDQGFSSNQEEEEAEEVNISAPEQNIVSVPEPMETSDYSTDYDYPSYEEPSDFDSYEEEGDY